MSRRTIIIRELNQLHVPVQLIADALDVEFEEASDLAWGTLEPQLDQVPALLDLLGRSCRWAKTVIREMRQKRPDADARKRIDAYERTVRDAEAAHHLYMAVWSRGRTNPTDVDGWALTLSFQEHLEDAALKDGGQP